MIWDLKISEEINIELLVDGETINISSKDNLSSEKKVLYHSFDKKPNTIKIKKVNNQEINSNVYDKNIEELNKNVFIKNM